MPIPCHDCTPETCQSIHIGTLRNTTGNMLELWSQCHCILLGLVTVLPLLPILPLCLAKPAPKKTKASHKKSYTSNVYGGCVENNHLSHVTTVCVLLNSGVNGEVTFQSIMVVELLLAPYWPIENEFLVDSKDVSEKKKEYCRTKNSKTCPLACGETFSADKQELSSGPPSQLLLHLRLCKYACLR